MLFGLGMVLTSEENERLSPITKPCFAALGLANDYFSFDVELQQAKSPEERDSMTNAVWLFMKWYDIDVQEAKRRVKQRTMAYERDFLHKWQGFLQSQPPPSSKLQEYLLALSYQVPGNVIWSQTCLRYHPQTERDSDDIMAAKDALEMQVVSRRDSVSPLNGNRGKPEAMTQEPACETKVSTSIFPGNVKNQQGVLSQQVRVPRLGDWTLEQYEY